MQQGLGGRAAQGSVWILAGTGVQGLLQLLVLATLARLLEPADFGVASAALIVVGVSLLVSLLGIGPAIVQRREVSDELINSGFILSAAFGVLSMLSLCWLAPTMAVWFRMEGLEQVLYGVSVVFLIQGVGAVPEAVMRRDLRFRPLALIQGLSFIFGYGAIGIVAAYLGFGPWALVFAFVAQNLLKMVSLLVAQPCSRGAPFSLRAATTLLGFGGGLMVAQIGNYVASYGDKAVAGRWLGAGELGVYGNAFQLMLMPATFFGQVFDDLFFPLMSRVAHQPNRLARAYRAGLAVNCLVMMPISVVMFELAPELVSVVFGPDWDVAVLPFQILILSMMFRASSRVADVLVRASGAVYKGAVRHWLYALMVVSGALIGQMWGVTGVAIGVTCALFANFVLVMTLSVSLTTLRWAELGSVIVRPLVLTSCAWIVAALVAELLRKLLVHQFIVIGVSACACGVVLGTLILTCPSLCLGPDGTWIATSLIDRLPKRFDGIRGRIHRALNKASNP